MGLSEEEITELLKERKPLPTDYLSQMVAKPKSDCRYIDTDLNVKGADGHKFILTICRNTMNPTAFSIILHYIEEKTNKDYLLIRCNGKHVHYNKLEKEKISGFHIHIATTRYLAMGNNNPGYAYETKEYSNWGGALDTMIRGYGFQVGKIPRLDSFPEKEE